MQLAANSCISRIHHLPLGLYQGLLLQRRFRAVLSALVLILDLSTINHSVSTRETNSIGSYFVLLYCVAPQEQRDCTGVIVSLFYSYQLVSSFFPFTHSLTRCLTKKSANVADCVPHGSRSPSVGGRILSLSSSDSVASQHEYATLNLYVDGF